jgi:hypothetical protein
MTTPITATFLCAACSQPAATIKLDSAVLVQSGFMGQITETIGDTNRPLLQQALDHHNARALYNLNILWSPF